MNPPALPEPAELAEQATAQIMADLAGGHRGVVVDSPPGAGKSALVVRARRALLSGANLYNFG